MTWVLIALLVVPLVGALVVAFLRKNDTKAKFVALAFSLVELVLAVLLWTAYDPDGELERRPLIINERELAALRRELDGTPRMRALLKRLLEE